MLINAFQSDIPQSWKQAVSAKDSDQWIEASQLEYDSLIEMGTWKLMPLPKGRKATKCRWFYVIKSDGRYKARLVAKGFTQVHRIDYEETFSPVA